MVEDLQSAPKKPKKQTLLLGIIAWVIIIWAAFTFLSRFFKPDKPLPTISVSAIRLTGDYLENPVSAGRKYDGRALLVGGTVDYISRSDFRFKIPGVDPGVLAAADDDTLAQLKPGAWVKVLCESVSEGGLAPRLSDCRLQTN